MRISAVQMQIIDGCPQENRRTLQNLLDGSPSADLYLVPELWTCGYDHLSWQTIADSDTPETLEWMGEQARLRKAWLGGTLIAHHAEGGLVNRFVLFDRSGRLVAWYDKVHLFGPMKEKSLLKEGIKLPPIIGIEGMRVAPAICYDLRFPEMFRKLALQGVDLFVVACEWPQVRSYALKALSEARAVENQAFLLVANRIGKDTAGTDFCGQSGIYGPEGIIAVENRPVNALVEASITKDQLKSVREAFPVFLDCVQGLDDE